MTTDEFLKSQYEGEIDRRYQLTGSLSVPIAVLSVLSGALLAMAQSLRVPFSGWDWAIFTVAAGGAISAIVVGYYLARLQLGHDYSYVATAKQINEYRESLERYYLRHGQSVAGVDEEVRSFIKNDMIESAHVNALRNDVKSGYLNRAYVALAVCAAFTFTAAIPYTASKVLERESGFVVKTTVEVR